MRDEISKHKTSASSRSLLRQRNGHVIGMIPQLDTSENKLSVNIRIPVPATGSSRRWPSSYQRKRQILVRSVEISSERAYA